MAGAAAGLGIINCAPACRWQHAHDAFLGLGVPISEQNACAPAPSGTPRSPACRHPRRRRRPRRRSGADVEVVRLMKPPSRMLTSWPLMVAMPLRPATGNRRLSGARQPPRPGLGLVDGHVQQLVLVGTMTSLSSR
jgi:hypothetical protein